MKYVSKRKKCCISYKILFKNSESSPSVHAKNLFPNQMMCLIIRPHVYFRPWVFSDYLYSMYVLYNEQMLKGKTFEF